MHLAQPRKLAAMLLAALMCSPVAGAGHAAAASVSADSDISPSRFPSLQAVARIFPEYRGGTRELFRGRQLVSGDTSVGRDWFVFTYVRERRFLVLSFLQRDRNAPAARSAFRLARASVRAVS